MAIKFAGKKAGWSQSDKGFVLRILVSPDDDWQEIATAPLGQPFGVVMVPIDPETGLMPDVKPPKEEKPRVPFAKMKRAQQAGIMANNPSFQFWASANPIAGYGGPVPDAAEYIRVRCGVTSRTELDSDEAAARRWGAVLAAFEQATGRIAEVRG